MLSKGNDIVCVSLSEDTLKIVQIKGSGANPKVVNVVSKDVTGVSDMEMPKVIQSSLGGFNTKFSMVVSAISPTMTTTKNIEIPSVNAEEINSIVSLQAGRHTPYSRDEIQIGYLNLGVHKENYTKVLLVIANKNILKSQLEIFEKAGLKIKKVLFSPEGVSSFYTDALNIKDEAMPTGVIDIGKQSTDFIIVFRGMAITTRNIPVGRSQMESEGDGARQKLVDELGKTIEAYQSDDIGDVPTNFVITNDDEQTQTLLPLLKEKLNWDALVSPYVDNIKAGGGVLKKIATQFNETSFLDVIGSGASAESAQINLIPEEVQLKKSIEDQGRELSRLCATAFLVFAVLMGAIWTRIIYHKKYLDSISAKYSGTREEVKELETISNNSKIVRDFMMSRMESLDSLNELYTTIPKEIYLTSLGMDEVGIVTIQGISAIGSSVYKLNRTLKKSVLFRSADVKSKTAKKVAGKDAHAFEISLKLKTAVEDEVEEIQEE